jgi:hypothetical protein
MMRDDLSEVEVRLKSGIQQKIDLLFGRPVRIGPSSQIQTGHPPPYHGAQLPGMGHAAGRTRGVIASQDRERLKTVGSGASGVHQAVFYGVLGGQKRHYVAGIYVSRKIGGQVTQVFLFRLPNSIVSEKYDGVPPG